MERIAQFKQVIRCLQRRACNADARKLRVLTRHYTYEPLALALPRNDDDFRLSSTGRDPVLRVTEVG